MPVTREQCEALYHGQTLHHATRKNADGTPMRVRKSGTVKIWKSTGEWRMPVKFGLYESGYIGTREVGNTRDDCSNPENWSLQP